MEGRRRDRLSYRVKNSSVHALAMPSVAQRPVLDRGKMTASGIYVSSTQDREGDIIDIAGINLTNHMVLPVVLLDHGKTFHLPIGQTRDEAGNYTCHLYPNEGYGRQTTYFSQSLLEAEQVFRLIDEGVMGGQSIGFQGEILEPIGRRGKRTCNRVRACDQVEVSWTAVPCNPETVADFPQMIRSVLSKGVVCGKSLSPAIRRSLQPYAARRQPLANGWTPGPVQGKSADWDENKHPRDHGKFSSSPGAAGGGDGKPESKKQAEEKPAQAKGDAGAAKHGVETKDGRRVRYVDGKPVKIHDTPEGAEHTEDNHFDTTARPGFTRSVHDGSPRIGAMAHLQIPLEQAGKHDLKNQYGMAFKYAGDAGAAEQVFKQYGAYHQSLANTLSEKLGDSWSEMLDAETPEGREAVRAEVDEVVAEFTSHLEHSRAELKNWVQTLLEHRRGHKEAAAKVGEISDKIDKLFDDEKEGLSSLADQAHSVFEGAAQEEDPEQYADELDDVLSSIAIEAKYFEGALKDVHSDLDWDLDQASNDEAQAFEEESTDLAYELNGSGNSVEEDATRAIEFNKRSREAGYTHHVRYNEEDEAWEAFDDEDDEFEADDIGVGEPKTKRLNRQSRRRLERLETTSLVWSITKSWDESRHKRGQPGNPGQFGSGGGSSTTASTGSIDKGKQEPKAVKRSGASQWQPLQRKEPKTAAASVGSTAKIGAAAAFGAVAKFASTVGHLEHAAVNFIDKQVSRLPKPLEKTVRGTYAVAMASYSIAQKAVAEVAKERGLPPEHIDTVTKWCSAVDLVGGGKGFPMALKAAGLGGFALAGSFVPIGSLSYLAFSTAKDPMATYRAAKSGVASALKALRITKSLDQEQEITDDGNAIVSEIVDRAVRIGVEDLDAYMACVLAAMDATEGDLQRSLEVADHIGRRGAMQTKSLISIGEVTGEDTDHDFDQRIDAIADILGGLFGDDALAMIDASSDRGEKSWHSGKNASVGHFDESKVKRDHGKFSSTGGGGKKPEESKPAKQAKPDAAAKPKREAKPKPPSRQERQAAAHAGAKDTIAKIKGGDRSPEAHKELMGHLENLTVKQLHDLKKEHGLKASAKVKSALVEKLAGRLRDGMPKKSAEKPRSLHSVVRAYDFGAGEKAAVSQDDAKKQFGKYVSGTGRDYAREDGLTVRAAIYRGEKIKFTSPFGNTVTLKPGDAVASPVGPDGRITGTIHRITAKEFASFGPPKQAAGDRRMPAGVPTTGITRTPLKHPTSGRTSIEPPSKVEKSLTHRKGKSMPTDQQQEAQETMGAQSLRRFYGGLKATLDAANADLGVLDDCDAKKMLGEHCKGLDSAIAGLGKGFGKIYGKDISELAEEAAEDESDAEATSEGEGEGDETEAALAALDAEDDTEAAAEPAEKEVETKAGPMDGEDEDEGDDEDNMTPAEIRQAKQFIAEVKHLKRLATAKA